MNLSKMPKKMRKLIHFILHDAFRVFGINKRLKTLFAVKKTKIELPQDDGFIDHMDIQWWYWTGHLTDSENKKYGFEVVFFAFNSWIFFKNILAQAAISDISSGKYIFKEEVSFLTLPKKLPSFFELKSKHGEINANGGNGEDLLDFKIGDYRLQLSLKEQEAPVMHYDGNLHKYTFGGNSYYYSREKMATSGTLTIADTQYEISGTSWFDRQYGELYPAIFKGWQWFAIELANGESIMIYYYRETYKTERFASITLGKNTTTLDYEKIDVIVIDFWHSPHTDIKYPAGWQIKLDDRQYIVKPAIADQELRGQHLFWVGPEYWEGACQVYDENEQQTGDAYVELNGFGTHLISIDENGKEVIGI